MVQRRADDESGGVMSEQGKVHSTTFGKVPPELMHDESITDGAVRLYAHMHWRYGQNQQNFEGQRSMAAYLHVSTTTIRKRIEELESHDWVVTIHREFNKKTGNFSTPFYHVFVSQVECRDYRETCELAEGEVLYEQPLPLERKSRKGVGGKPSNLTRTNSSSIGHANSSSHGGDNSSYIGGANSSSHYPESVYPDSSNPEPIIDSVSPSKKSGKSESNELIDITIKAWLDGQTAQPVMNQYGNKGVRSNAKAIAAAGFTPEQVTGFVKSTAAMPYWTGKLVPIGYVANNIAAHCAAHPRIVPEIEIVPPAPAPDDTLATPEQIEQARAMFAALVKAKAG